MYENCIKELQEEKTLEERILSTYEHDTKKTRRFNKFYIKHRSHRGTERFYKVNRKTKKEKYVPEPELPEVAEIQVHYYKLKVMEIIKSNLEAIELFLSTFKPISPQYILSLLADCYHSTPLEEIFEPLKSAKEWKAEMEARKAQSKVHREEDLTNIAVDGTKVRSRAEMLIYNYLYALGFTFVYELPTIINGQKCIPDFTIYLPLSGRVIIWEHLGMIYNHNYYDAQFYKICNYAEDGFTPGDNLILTVDKKDGTFDMTIIKRIVDTFLRDTPVGACA